MAAADSRTPQAGEEKRCENKQLWSGESEVDGSTGKDGSVGAWIGLCRSFAHLQFRRSRNGPEKIRRRRGRQPQRLEH